MKETEKIIQFLKKNYLYLTIGSIIVVAGVTTILIFNNHGVALKNNEQLSEEASKALEEENYQEAEDYYQTLVNRDPQNYSYHYSLAKVYHYQKDYQQAYQQYDKTYQLESTRGEVLNLMANCQRELGDYDKAEELYRKAITQLQVLGTPYLNLSAMLYTQGKVKQAKQVLRDGIESNPNLTSLKTMLKRIK